SSLILDNTAANNPDRLPDATTIDLYGALRLIGNANNSTETVGAVTPRANFTSTIESDTTGSTGTARLTLGALNATGTAAAVPSVGGGTPLSDSGRNQIAVLQAPSGNMPFNNSVFANAVVLNPDGSADLATMTGGAAGRMIIPLPGDAYVTSFAAANASSNV